MCINAYGILYFDFDYFVLGSGQCPSVNLIKVISEMLIM